MSSADHNKNTWLTKELAEASIALCQLIQWMTKPEYNGDWKPNWSDNSIKYVIQCDNGFISRPSTYLKTQILLAFNEESKRDAFFEEFRDLIEIAKPLI